MPELEEAHRARVPYLEPASLSEPDGRTERIPDPMPLQESYATQVYLQDGDLVRPLPALPAPVRLPDADQPGTRWIVTGWNAGGAPRTLRRQERDAERLRRRVLDAGGLVAGEGVTAAPTRAWIEDHLVVTGLPEAVVVRLGLEAGQPAVVARTGDALTVVPTGLRDDVTRVSLEFVVEPVPTTCPMRVDGVPGARCAQRGGPFGSAAIHAATIWGAHRRLLLARLPCAACADGSEPVLGVWGRGISLGGMALPSRYGGWAWA